MILALAIVAALEAALLILTAALCRAASRRPKYGPPLS